MNINELAFKVNDLTTAPKDVKDRLSKIDNQMGFIPNILGVLSESPATFETYLNGMDLLHTKTNFSDEEIAILLLTVSVENKSDYCIKSHSVAAKKTHLTQDDIDSIINNEPLNNTRYNAIMDFTRLVVINRGCVSEEEVQNFINHGYNQQDLLDIILIISLKTITNYTNHIIHTKLDRQFD